MDVADASPEAVVELLTRSPRRSRPSSSSGCRHCNSAESVLPWEHRSAHQWELRILVGHDHRCGAQRLHRTERSHHGIAVRHPQHASRQSQRPDDRQTFRNCRHGQCNRRLDHLPPGLTRPQAQQTDQNRHPKGQPDQLPGQNRQPLLKR
mgnify:CR=1 FL=1